jgi:nucleoid-associated protein YgaU
MTRETKIGLLVGLAFVIMTGILLSNYLSSTNEPPGAALKIAADTVRSGLGEPGNDDVAPMLRAPAVVAPSQQVVINAELNHRTAQPPVRFVPPTVAASAPAHGNAITPSVPLNQPSNALDRIRQSAAQQGEQLIPANDPPAVFVSNPKPNTVTPQAQPTKTTARTYEAQAGDSLGRIAQKMYGSGCKANRDAIVAANPSLAQNRDLIVAGRSYIIPALGSASSPAAPAVQQPSADKSVVYVVQPNDTLWSIATEQLGNAGAVAAIEELNKVVLNGSDQLRPNMKLKLPAKKSAE